MHVALGNRYSGVFATSDELARAGGCRRRARPASACACSRWMRTTTAALDSKIADVKQCTLDGEADHILAARFLKRFTGERPWIHMDLSAQQLQGRAGRGGDAT